MKRLSSIHNPELKRLRLLIQKARERKKQQRFVIEGEREILKAILGGYQLESIFIYEGSDSHFSILFNKIPNARIHSVSSAVFQQLSIRSGSEKILAIGHSKTHELSKLKIDRDSLILVLEAPEKPGNIGALYRTATAAQMDAVLIANPKTDFYNPNSIRSSLGSQFLMPTAIATSEQVVSFLRKNQFQIATAALHPDAIPYDTFDYTPPCAVVMGTESTGLNKEWLENTDQHLIIPMDKSIDSLNLSVSAGILMYEAIRHKKSLN